MIGEVECSEKMLHGRLRKAEQFLFAAETIADVLDRDDDPDVDDAYVTLLVHDEALAARGRPTTPSRRTMKAPHPREGPSFVLVLRSRSVL